MAMYEAIGKSLKNKSSLKYVINSSRRLGKSYLMCLIAAEYAMTDGRYPVLFAAPTQKALRNIIKPLFRQIFATCPDEMRPKMHIADSGYRFPSGGEIHIAGVNAGHEDDLRGTAAGLCLIDEAGMVTDLDYLVNDIMMPQLLTTGGNLVMASTPPRTPIHSFVDFANRADAIGNYSKYTIYDSGYKPELIEQFCDEAGGKESTTWRREYLCDFVVDENFAIVPEYCECTYNADDKFKHYRYFHKYVAMDIGGRDKTAILFAYYDFDNAQLVVEDEVIFSGRDTTTKMIADAVISKEKELWGYGIEKNARRNNPHMRIADNNNIIMLQDLGQLHNVHFLATNKDNLHAMVNKVRLWFQQKRIAIKPCCKQTIGCVKYGIWNDHRTEFARNKEFGHYDALASLVYLIRNVDETSNPIPHIMRDENDRFDMQIDKRLEKERLTRDAEEIAKLFIRR